MHQLRFLIFLQICFTDRDDKGSIQLVAKISDFGLSKTFYDNIRYKRHTQDYDVPWKWMALEYLQNDHLTITSDVWSYGVVLWEIFSCGKEPYVSLSVDDMLSQLKKGYTLPCPEESLKVSISFKFHYPLNVTRINRNVLGISQKSDNLDLFTFR